MTTLRVRLYRFMHYRLPYYFVLIFPAVCFFAIFSFLTVEGVRTTLSAFVQSIPAIIALIFAVTFFIEQQGEVARHQLERHSMVGRKLARKILRQYKRMEKQRLISETKLKLDYPKELPEIELLKLITEKKTDLERLLTKPDLEIMPGLFTWLAGAPFPKSFLEEPDFDKFHSIIESYIRPIHTQERARGRIFKVTTLLGLITTILSIFLLATVCDLPLFGRIIANVVICLGISSILFFGLYVYDVLLSVYVRRPAMFVFEFES